MSGELAYDHNQFKVLMTGFFAAFISGLLACTWMIRLVKNSKLKYFAFYCAVVGFFTVIYYLI